MIRRHDIMQAATVLEGRVRRTELIPSHYFSERLGDELLFKCENLQRTGSFKIRGALNFLSGQPAEALARGVVTASAGNHAQGIALGASLLGIPALVVMPEDTPLAKLVATQHYGAEVLLFGAGFDEAVARARELEQERGMLYAPAFDDNRVIAGQGTIGLELLEQAPQMQTLVVPVGGGGLIGGIALAVKEARPEVRLIGVEAEAVPSALAARRAGHPIALPPARSLADGIAVKRVGERTFPLIEKYVDELVTVPEAAIAQAVVSLLERGKLVAEGAGAVGLAALLYGPKPIHRGITVCLLSGGNIDVRTIAKVVERGLVAEGRYLKLQMEIADTPGSLARLALAVADTGANIFEVTHDRQTQGLALGQTAVRLVLETRGPEHIRQILQDLRHHGYRPEVER